MRFPVPSTHGALCLFLTVSSWAAAATPGSHETPIPSVTVKNGTINGLHLAEYWDQDVFLGIPYAQPPLGPLRFKWPQPLNETYETPLDVSSYGYSCYQDSFTLNISEDCLTLNVVRPHNVTEADKLPVLVWIYGGGLFAGSSADPQYNLSGLVRLSQDSSQPIIAVSINYRIGIFGFLQTPQVLAEGSANAGLLDQRLALRWIQENIGAFGGDPERVTVWGESAGAQSIALHLHSFGGRDDDDGLLFRAAILESGSAIGVALQPLSFYASRVDTLTRTVGCNDTSDQLACLRGVAPEKLFSARVSIYWYPLVDGTFLTDYPSALDKTNSFIKIPLLLGTNSDEGITFGPTGFNDSISPASARKLLQLYPNEPSQEPPYDIANDTVFPEKGLQWRRSCAIYGDIVMVAGRRKLCAAYAGARQPVYSYRFATRPPPGFQNISGSLGPLPEFQSHKDISVDIGKSYLNFVYWHDPNGSEKGLQTALPHWPTWTTAKPSNMVLNATRPVVEDNFRERGIAFIQSISRELLA
ncbi:alpha/beta-hydrolase [Xylaria sp. FL0064]|nr:alpha/beta-hydrolase [Xylaria sp. FL0064]